MGRNLFQYALLGGIEGAADGAGQAMQQQQRFDQERQLTAEREAERRRYLDDQQAGYMERDGARIAARGGVGRAGGGGAAPAAPFDPMTADANVAYRLGKTQDELQAYERGDDLVTRTKKLTEDGANPVIAEDRPMGFEELMAKRKEELKALRAGERFGKDLDDVAKGESTMAETERLRRVEGGSNGAATAQLVSKGKGPYDGDRTGSTNILTGEQTINAIGRSEVGENAAQAGKANAEALKAGREVLEGAKGGGAARERISSALNSVAATVKNLSENKPGSKASPEDGALYERSLTEARALQAALLAEMKRAREQPADAAAPAAPAAKPTGKAPPASALKEGVKTTFKNGGGTWTLKNGQPVKVS